MFRGAFTGIKAAVCALILVSAVRLGKQILRTPFQWILAAASFCRGRNIRNHGSMGDFGRRHRRSYI